MTLQWLKNSNNGAIPSPHFRSDDPDPGFARKWVAETGSDSGGEGGQPVAFRIQVEHREWGSDIRLSRFWRAWHRDESERILAKGVCHR